MHKSVAACLIAVFFLGLFPAAADAQFRSTRRMRRDANRIKAVYLRDYRKALPKFESSVKQLESALAQQPPKLQKLGKELEKQTDTFLRYIKLLNEEHPDFEPEDLTKYSNVELGWEALTSSETLVPLLIKIPDAENSAVVSLDFWRFLYLVEAELQKLKWMTSRLR